MSNPQTTMATIPVEADKAETLLNQALKIVTGERRKKYGKPEDNFAVIADLWNTYTMRRMETDHDYSGIKPEDVAHMMVLMKVARLAETPRHPDSIRDIAGYAACAARAGNVDLTTGAP